MATDYADVVRALEADDTARVWLREYAKGWPEGAGVPREIRAVQREIDRDNETPRKPPCGWRTSEKAGRRMLQERRCWST